MYVLDTDVAVEYLRGNKEVVDSVLSLKEICSTVITMAELSYGTHKSRRVGKHWEKLVGFARGVTILGIDLAVCQKFGELKEELAKKGKEPGDFDLLIASICIVNGCHLVTKNKKHYRRIKGLKMYDL